MGKKLKTENIILRYAYSIGLDGLQEGCCPSLRSGHYSTDGTIKQKSI